VAGIVVLRGSSAVAGTADGVAAVTDVPLSFWGGLDPETGEVIDRRHPLSGTVIAGRVLVMPAGRGSCTASGVLLETIRNRVAPAGIVLSRPDPIIGLGAILGEELYGRTVPVVVLSETDRAAIPPGARVAIDPFGTVIVAPPADP
jgi:predicted aconitase with swiveling domain